MQDYHCIFYTMAAETSARIGDGLMTSGGDPKAIGIFKASGGEGKPCYTEISVCWAKGEAEAKRIAYEQWPIAANEGELNRDLATPAHYEQLARMVDAEDVAKKLVIGPDPKKYIDKLNKVIDAGYDHISIHQLRDILIIKQLQGLLSREVSSSG